MNDITLNGKLDSASKVLWTIACSYDILDKDSELELAKKMDEGFKAIEKLNNVYDENEYLDLVKAKNIGNKAYEKLTKHNLRLVFKIASYYENKGLDYSQLVSDGLVGLKNGLHKFNYRLGFRVSTYVTNWISQAITRSLENNGKTIKIPSNVRTRIKELLIFKEDYFKNNHHLPTEEECAKALGVDVVEINLLSSLNYEYIKLDKIVDNSKTTICDLIKSNDKSLYDLELERQKLEQLDSIINKLSDKESFVIRNYYGLNNFKTHTLLEIAGELGCSKEYVRQLRNKALVKIKDNVLETNLYSI